MLTLFLVIRDILSKQNLFSFDLREAINNFLCLTTCAHLATKFAAKMEENAMESNFKKLKKTIIDLSVEKNDFNKAKLEWELFRIYFTNEFGQCHCGQKIKKHCHLRNTKNGNETWVGTSCVKKFMDIDSGSLFDGLKRLQKKIDAKPNTVLIDYAWRNGYLYGQNELNFLKRIQSKRKMPAKQNDWLIKINRRILQMIVVRQMPHESNENRSNHETIGDIDSSGLQRRKWPTFIPLRPKFVPLQ